MYLVLHFVQKLLMASAHAQQLASEKEKASLEDMEIVPAAELEAKDEMFEMLTALGTDFHLIDILTQTVSTRL